MIRLTALGIGLIAASALVAGDPQAQPKKEMIDVEKTAERIVQNANEAGKRLGAKDPGADTRKIQDEILKDIDALIRKAQEPPPDQDQQKNGGMSNMGGGMSNMGGGMSKQNMNPSDPSAGPPSRQQRRERARQNAANTGDTARQPQPMIEPMQPDRNGSARPNGTSPNRIESKAAMPRAGDVYKEVWGHLPEKMRQEMDLYFRDRFMPRYSELLRQYYSSLAERGSKTGP